VVLVPFMGTGYALFYPKTWLICKNLKANAYVIVKKVFVIL
jgi:hypothetical protein